MSNSDQATNNGLIPSERNLSAETPEFVLNEASNLEKLIPKNLSNNKRAVIERLIALHLSQAT